MPTKVNRNVMLARGIANRSYPDGTVFVESGAPAVKAWNNDRAVRYPGQTDNEFMILVCDAMAFAGGAKYLRRREGNYVALINEDAGVVLEDLLASPERQGDRRLLLWPESDSEDYNAMIAEIEAHDDALMVVK